MDKGIKIVSLSSKNVLRLNAVEINPDGSLIIIGGKNAQGKTSVLDSIMLALGGRKAKHQEPLKQGKKKGEAVVELTNGLIVKRKFTTKTNTVSITDSEGQTLSSPQQILDKFCGTLTFDPLDFTTMDSKKQLLTLKNLVGLDFTQLDADRKDFFTTRADTKKEVKVLEGKMDGVVEDKTAPMVEVSVQQLMDELREAEQHNKKGEEAQQELDKLKAAHQVKKDGIQEHLDMIEDIKKEITVLESAMDGLREAGQVYMDILENHETVDTQPIQAKIYNADSINAQVRSNNLLNGYRSEKRKLDKVVDNLSNQIADIDENKASQLADASFPIPNLGFDEDTVLFNGIPFDQASHAEQLRTSIAMGIAINPELKVLLIRSGSRLDEDNLKLVADMAEESGHQVWLERVGTGDECQVIMEDGYVKD